MLMLASVAVVDSAIINIDPWGFEVYEDLTAEVGDEIVFVWEKYVERTKATNT